MWEGGLQATGGAIEPSKTTWYSLEHVWDKDQWRYKTTAETPGSLEVRGPDGHRHIIQRLEPTQASKTLGVYLAPNGSNDAEFAHLQTMSQEWSVKIRQSHLP